MTHEHELFVSTTDAAALAAMLGAHRRASRLESDASDELAERLHEARLVAAERLPGDRVAMRSTVTYAEEPSGVQRTVTLAYPEEADAARGRISVLSPIGLALIGRRRGSVIAPAMPGGRALKIRLLGVIQNPELLREAA